MKIVLCGEASKPSGFGRVTLSLHRALAALEPDTCTLDTMTWTDRSADHRGDNGILSTPQHRLAEELHKLAPDVFIVNGNAWTYPFLGNSIREALGDRAVALYFVIEYETHSKFLIDGLADVDHIVTPTRWARDMLRRQMPESGSRRFSVIPHGVDLDCFFPITDTSEVDTAAKPSSADLRRQLFPERPDVWEAFVVLNGNQNVWRKRLDLTLKGFAEFSAEIDDARLVLPHASSRHGILNLIGDLGITHKVLIPGPTSMNRFTDRQLNSLYNACDVGLNTAMGEGWGMVSHEHAATAAAQVLPGSPVLKEIWGDSALYLPARRTALHGPHNRQCHLVDVVDIADRLNRLYKDPVLLTSWSRRAFEFATRDRFSWDSIGKKWLAMARGLAGVRCTESLIR